MMIKKEHHREQNVLEHPGGSSQESSELPLRKLVKEIIQLGCYEDIILIENRYEICYAKVNYKMSDKK